MKINHSFQINSLLELTPPPPPPPHTHFLENYFAEVKIKNDQNHFYILQKSCKMSVDKGVWSVAGTTTLDREWF